jgi:hypothetical protein
MNLTLYKCLLKKSVIFGEISQRTRLINIVNPIAVYKFNSSRYRKVRTKTEKTKEDINPKEKREAPISLIYPYFQKTIALSIYTLLKVGIDEESTLTEILSPRFISPDSIFFAITSSTLS